MLFMRYFNPRSREGSDPTAVFLLHFPSISIHAPARGATAGITATQNLSQDFNPRSREGSDTVCSPFVISSQYFNPRSREGSDLPSWCIWSMASIISIHAPARGATGDAKDIWLAVRNFNPRSREGSDHKFISSASKMRYFNPRSREGSDIQPTRNKRETADKFQSTLPRGERPPSFPARSRCCRYFNPRSREGSDMPELRLTCGKKISIHAPARGATATASVGFARFVNFNPRSREGSDVLPSARPP